MPYFYHFHLYEQISILNIMDNGLRRGLINKKGAFEKDFEAASNKLQTIKHKNDEFQRHGGSNIQSQIKHQIDSQSEIIEEEIIELKELLQKMEEKYRDPQSRNRIKQLKVEAAKQIERNAIILKDTINRSFVRRLPARRSKEMDQAFGLIRGAFTNYKDLVDPVSTIHEQPEEQQTEIDLEMEKKMLHERKVLLDEVEQRTIKVQQIMNDMAQEVNVQGENLNVMTDNLQNTNQNVKEANVQLNEANELQKKARKKYITLIVIILLIVVVVSVIIIVKATTSG